MTHRSVFVCALMLATGLGTSRAPATEGGLDANGCHYDHGNGNYHCHREMPPNPDRYAAAKKSRDNICHDKSSPNYRKVRYFVAYRSMAECLRSGGREALSRGGGLSGDRP